MSWKKKATPAMKDLINQLTTQMDPTLGLIFHKTLDKLAAPSEEDKKKLEMFDALIAAGVDNWDGYDEALSEFEDEDEEDEDEE